MFLEIGKRWITRSNLILKIGTVRVAVLVIVNVEDIYQNKKQFRTASKVLRLLNALFKLYQQVIR